MWSFGIAVLPCASLLFEDARARSVAPVPESRFISGSVAPRGGVTSHHCRGAFTPNGPCFRCLTVYNVLSYAYARSRTVALVPEVPSPFWAGHFLVP